MAFLNNIANRVGATINNKIGEGINSLTGLNFASEDIPLYEDFLYNILSDADNAVTVPAYWVVFFTPQTPVTVPSSKASIKSLLKGYVSDQFGVNLGGSDTSKSDFGWDVHPWKLGEKTRTAKNQFQNNAQNSMMLVQGIEIPGDGFTIDRMGADNVGGFLRPPVTGIRNDLPEMQITFLENNSSVTDLVLRPWTIHSSYSSLKFAVKMDVVCYNLTRSPSGFRVRKKFTFHNAVPMSIDAEKYDYSGDSAYTTRQTKFVFTDYTVDEGSPVKDGLLASVGNFILQNTRDFATDVVESGVDVLAGGANQVVTNVVGSFTDTVNDHLQDVQSRIREYAKDAEDSLIDKGQQFIDKSIGFTPDKDSIMRGGEDFPTSGTPDNPSPRVAVDAGSEDSLASPPVPPRSEGVANGAKYTLVSINTDDTVDSSGLNLQEVTINNNGEGLTTQSVEPPDEDVIRR